MTHMYVLYHKLSSICDNIQPKCGIRGFRYMQGSSGSCVKLWISIFLINMFLIGEDKLFDEYLNITNADLLICRNLIYYTVKKSGSVWAL